MGKKCVQLVYLARTKLGITSGFPQRFVMHGFSWFLPTVNAHVGNVVIHSFLSAPGLYISSWFYTVSTAPITTTFFVKKKEEPIIKAGGLV